MTSPVYSIPSVDACVVRTLDDVTLIYHRPSGQTHMVVSPVPEILAALGDGAGDAEEIYVRLSRAFDLGQQAGAMAAVDRHLRELAALGLVRVAGEGA
jgi:PqqD family protein of HPr-rel-A system